MKKYQVVIGVGIIFGAFLRLWALGQNPPGLSWDEAALGYNAYSILRTGKDEWGVYLPLTLKSFHDYKPALYAYLAIPGIYLFGLNAWAVRLPSALAGITALVLVPWLAYQLARQLNLTKDQPTAWLVATVSTWLLAISPWHLQFSRAAFEANLGLTLFLLGATLFVWSMKISWLLPLSATAFAFSLYAYHAPRLLVPLWLMGAGLIWRRRLFKMKKIWLVGSLLLGVILGLPLVRVAQYGGLTTRVQTVKISTGHQEGSGRYGILTSGPVAFGRNVITGYLAHFNPKFLVIKGDATDLDPTARHRAVDTGVMLWLSLPFFGYGLYRLVEAHGKGKTLLFLWLLLGPLPASLTKEAPHAIRSLLTLPAPPIITAIGLVLAVKSFKRWPKLVAVVLTFLFAVNFAVYFHNYRVHTPVEWSRYWQDGYQEVVRETARLAPGYQKVVVTRKYDQPYIFFLFYGQVDPAWYQENGRQDGFGPYQFRDFDLETENKDGLLLVAAPDEVGEKGRVLKKVYFLNGQEAFRLVDFP